LVRGAVKELALLQDLEKIEADYKSRFGSPPYNLSHWDPSNRIQERLLSSLELPIPVSEIPYCFSYELEELPSIIVGLGCNTNSTGCLVTPSGSASIQCVLSFFRSLGVKSIAALCPCYFTVPYACQQLNINLTRIYLRRSSDGFEVPDIPSMSSFDAIWITNPVYCAGVYPSAEYDSLVAETIAAGSFVVVDECLCEPGLEMVRKWGKEENFLSIVSPHKSLCINGLKFSAILMPKVHLGIFDQWADIQYGCLSPTNHLAVRHYLSGNFALIQAKVRSTAATEAAFAASVCDSLSNLEYDCDAVGYLRTYYAGHIPGSRATDVSTLSTIIDGCGVSLIPGQRNHFSTDIPFCLRVNLMRSGSEFRGAFSRLLNYLDAFRC